MPRQGGYSVQHTGQARAAGQVRKIIKSGLATLGKERETCVYFPATCHKTFTCGQAIL